MVRSNHAKLSNSKYSFTCDPNENLQLVDSIEKSIEREIDEFKPDSR